MQAGWLLVVVFAPIAVVACSTTRSQVGTASAPASSATGAAEIVQKQVDAYNSQDLDAFLATYADDAMITSAANGQVVMNGKEAMRQRYGDMFRRFPKNRVQIVARKREGEKVVIDHEVITGRSPERPDPWDVGWVRYEVEDGLIRRVQLP